MSKFQETIGVSETEVNDTMEWFNKETQNALDQLTAKFNDLIKALTDNWGSEDAKKTITDTTVPGLKALGENIALTLKSIGDTIKKVAIAQAEATSNTINVTEATQAELGPLVNNVSNVLDNGYIGIYNTLIQEVKDASENLQTVLNNRLDYLKGGVKAYSEKAFTDEGNSVVATSLAEYIGAIKNHVSKKLEELETELNNATTGLTTYEKSIQTDSSTAISSVEISG